MTKKVEVLIVDDSASARELLAYIINSDERLNVIGSVKDGEEALRFVKTRKPDVITMDIVMPKMDGFETTKRIMQTTPIPIIIISSSFCHDDIEKSFKAMDAGSVAILEKPQGPKDLDFAEKKKTILDTINTMSEVKLITRRHSQGEPPAASQEVIKKDRTINAIAIGTSLGGPQALHQILTQLSPHCSVPIFIVQHIASGFVHGFVEWLNNVTPLDVKLSVNGYHAKGGDVIIAADGHHLGINRDNTVVLSDGPPEGGIKPAASHLFHSVAEAHGKNSVGIILTGMGRDGVAELLYMRQKGAMTIAQDEKDCTMFGMPKEAAQQGAAQHILSLDEIAHTINILTGVTLPAGA